MKERKFKRAVVVAICVGALALLFVVGWLTNRYYSSKPAPRNDSIAFAAAEEAWNVTQPSTQQPSAQQPSAHQHGAQQYTPPAFYVARVKPCPVCFGTGLVVCPQCLGAGIEEYEEVFYLPYSGSVRIPRIVRCGRCNGTGLVACSNCGGRGAIVVRELSNTPESDPNTMPCPDCGGMGVQKDYASPQGWRTCPRCKGAGWAFRY